MDVERELVETYFESNGFLVRQTGNLEVVSGRKKHEKLVTLGIFNPAVSHNASMSFRLYTSDLSKIRSGLVTLLGWGNSDFANGMLNNDSSLVKFFKKEVKDSRLNTGFNSSSELAQSGMGPLKRLLIVPALPRNETKAGDVFSMLKEIVVDGVLTLRSLLENLLKQTEPANLYPGKPFFQILKLLKVYELAKEPQLEMF
jgi:hypothetical protein